jgi:hypothetical protein
MVKGNILCDSFQLSLFVCVSSLVAVMLPASRRNAGVTNMRFDIDMEFSFKTYPLQSRYDQNSISDYVVCSRGIKLFNNLNACSPSVPKIYLEFDVLFQFSYKPDVGVFRPGMRNLVAWIPLVGITHNFVTA